MDTLWAPLRLTGNAGRVWATLSLSRGRIRRPSGMILQGGGGDAVDVRVGQRHAGPHWDSQGALEEFDTRSVFWGGRSFAPPE